MPDALKIHTIFFNPKDSPGLYVMRAFYIRNGQATPDAVAFSGHSLEEIRTHVPQGCVRLDREPEDDPSVIESWL